MSLSFKVVLLGEGRVGKTCLCLRYVQNSFSSDQESTIQATYLDKRLNVGKRSVKLMIWDTAGQERFHCLPVGTPLATFAGETINVEDVKAGTVLIGNSGQPSLVRDAFILPEKQPIYSIETVFTKNSYAATEDHRVTVRFGINPSVKFVKDSFTNGATHYAQMAWWEYTDEKGFHRVTEKLPCKVTAEVEIDNEDEVEMGDFADVIQEAEEENEMSQINDDEEEEKAVMEVMNGPVGGEGEVKTQSVGRRGLDDIIKRKAKEEAPHCGDEMIEGDRGFIHGKVYNMMIEKIKAAKVVGAPILYAGSIVDIPVKVFRQISPSFVQHLSAVTVDLPAPINLEHEIASTHANKMHTECNAVMLRAGEYVTVPLAREKNIRIATGYQLHNPFVADGTSLQDAHGKVAVTRLRLENAHRMLGIDIDETRAVLTTELNPIALPTPDMIPTRENYNAACRESMLAMLTAGVNFVVFGAFGRLRWLKDAESLRNETVQVVSTDYSTTDRFGVKTLTVNYRKRTEQGWEEKQSIVFFAPHPSMAEHYKRVLAAIGLAHGLSEAAIDNALRPVALKHFVGVPQLVPGGPVDVVNIEIAAEKDEDRRYVIRTGDATGDLTHNCLAPLYYRDAQGALLVYDITDRDSFTKVRHWVKELRKIVGKNIVLVIAGNKSDMEKKRQVDETEAEQYAATVGAIHIPTSAKTGKNVEAAFLELTKGMLKQTKANESGASSTAAGPSSAAASSSSSQRGFVDIGKETEPPNKSGCCS